MTNNLLSRGTILLAALALTACPTGKKCTTNADCSGGQTCSVMSGTCVTGTGGGIGGGLGGGGGAGGGGGGGGGGGSGGGTGGGSGNNDGGVNLGGETCEMAVTITPGTLQGNTTGMVSQYDPGCTGDVTPGPDTVYMISVPAGQRLTATATPELLAGMTGNQFDLGLYLIQAPASNCTNPDGGMALSTCLAGSDDPGANDAPETVGYLNTTAAAVDVFIVVDSFYDAMNTNPDGGVGASNEGRFTLVTNVAPLAAGDRCDSAPVLSTTTPLLNQDLANFGDDYDNSATGCRGSNAADATYQVIVPAGQVFSVTVNPEMTFDPTISIADGAAACGMTCMGAVDVGGNGVSDTYTYKNTTGAAQTLFIIIDGYQGSTGTFGLTATLTTPAADDTCSGPVALSTTPLTGQLIAGYSDDYGTATSTGCAFSSGVDRVYSVAVNDGQRVTITATPGAMANPSLSLVDGAASCGTTCVGSSNTALTGAVEKLAYTNRSGAMKTYLVVVDFSSSSTGTFEIVAAFDTPPTDDVCQAPTVVAINTPVTAQTTLNYTNDYQSGTGMVGCATSGDTSFDRVYQIAIPANQRGVVTVTPTADAGYNPSISLVEGAASVCGASPRVCAAGANFASSNVAETVSILNTTNAMKNYFAIVDSSSGAGTFDFGYTASAPIVDDTCTANTTLAAGTQASQNLTNFYPDYRSGTGCRTTRGPDRVYKVTLAANQRYTFTATPAPTDGGFDPVVNFIAGPAANCESGARRCAGGVDVTFANQAETGAYTNNSGASQDVFVIVADYATDSTNRTFTLVSSVGAVPAGETCGMPLALTAGPLPGQTTTGATLDVVFNDNSTVCIGGFGGYPDKVYSAVVPAGSTLTVTATPAAMEDLIINIIDGTALTCNDVMVCADAADTGFSGDPETATFMNSTGASKTVFVQVTGYDTDQNYSLTTTIQ